MTTNERKQWLQDNAERLIAEMEAERGVPLHPAWRDTMHALLATHGVDLPACHRVIDTVDLIERAEGRMPPRPPLTLEK